MNTVISTCSISYLDSLRGCSQRRAGHLAHARLCLCSSCSPSGMQRAADSARSTHDHAWLTMHTLATWTPLSVLSRLASSCMSCGSACNHKFRQNRAIVIPHRVLTVEKRISQCIPRIRTKNTGSISTVTIILPLTASTVSSASASTCALRLGGSDRITSAPSSAGGGAAGAAAAAAVASAARTARSCCSMISACSSAGSADRNTKNVNVLGRNRLQRGSVRRSNDMYGSIRVDDRLLLLEDGRLIGCSSSSSSHLSSSTLTGLISNRCTSAASIRVVSHLLSSSYHRHYTSAPSVSAAALVDGSSSSGDVSTSGSSVGGGGTTITAIDMVRYRNLTHILPYSPSIASSPPLAATAPSVCSISSSSSPISLAVTASSDLAVTEVTSDTVSSTSPRATLSALAFSSSSFAFFSASSLFAFTSSSAFARASASCQINYTMELASAAMMCPWTSSSTLPDSRYRSIVEGQLSVW
ncbi:hypothetical protein PRIPAC_81702 [Pristionchus pacificus]|uniref:Uncharacterized protein n=1 Tax=Pristionchus pacificus TaxID=54126 RepID=A0A2A6CPL6_PRIPA|nr:hypothetical protein PRIPAC_81702 [Pristionchus pacificus]|eukprot:PDM80007.1 hypothetical protein PRIPAC_32586 [Pristionchus pacificus]